jgi:hypothetical protein
MDQRLRREKIMTATRRRTQLGLVLSVVLGLAGTILTGIAATRSGERTHS